MGFRSNINPLDRGYYYALTGDDSWDGRSFELPKFDMQPAIDAAALLDPIPSLDNPASVLPSQPGKYAKPIVLIDGLIFDSVGVSLVTDSPVTIKASSFSGATSTLAGNTQDNSSTYEIDGEDLFGINARLVVNSGANGKLFDVKGSCNDIFINAENSQVSGDGGIGFSFNGVAGVPLPYTGGRLDLIGDNTTGVFWNPSSPSESGVCNLAAIETVAVNQLTGILQTGANTTAFDIQTGEYTATIPSVDVATFCQIASGGILNVNSPSTSGDINVSAGGVLNVILPNHNPASVITNNGTINGIINGIRYGNWKNRREMDTLLTADSFVNQLPVNLDVPIQVSFGAAQPPMLDVNGTFTAPENGQYEFTFSFQYGRSGSGGVSWLFFRLLKNGVQIGTTPFTKLENINADFPSEFNNTIDLLATETISVELWRDSRGNNSGGLLTENPLIGGTGSPSASISVKRSKEE